MDAGTIALLLAAAVLVVVGIWAFATYSGLTRLRALVRQAWQQVEVELHRRHDLVAGLVETVRGVAGTGSGVIADVVRARTEAAGPSVGPAEQAERENALTAALGPLLARAEASPELAADAGFLALRAELTGTEDRMAAGRRFYNANVRQLNARIGSFPARVLTRLLGFAPAEYFEADDPVVRAAPAVTFSDKPGTADDDEAPPRPLA